MMVNVSGWGIAQSTTLTTPAAYFKRRVWRDFGLFCEDA